MLDSKNASAVNSHWLILEPLKSNHVRQLITESTRTLVSTSTTSPSNFSFHKDCDDDQLDTSIGSVIEWTGGAPRPLLYIFNMLDELYRFGAQYKSKSALNDLFGDLVDYTQAFLENSAQFHQGVVNLMPKS